MSTILDYLTHMHETGLSVSYIKLHRSAISAFHKEVNGLSVGKHTMVSQLIRGASNDRLPRPRNLPVWDISVVLDFMDTTITQKLDIRMLSKKLATLLAITSLHRGSELHLLNLDLLSLFDDRAEFKFTDQHKHSKAGVLGKPSSLLQI